MEGALLPFAFGFRVGENDCGAARALLSAGCLLYADAPEDDMRPERKMMRQGLVPMSMEELEDPALAAPVGLVAERPTAVEESEANHLLLEKSSFDDSVTTEVERVVIGKPQVQLTSSSRPEGPTVVTSGEQVYRQHHFAGRSAQRASTFSSKSASSAGEVSDASSTDSRRRRTFASARHSVSLQSSAPPVLPHPLKAPGTVESPTRAQALSPRSSKIDSDLAMKPLPGIHVALSDAALIASATVEKHPAPKSKALVGVRRRASSKEGPQLLAGMSSESVSRMETPATPAVAHRPMPEESKRRRISIKPNKMIVESPPQSPPVESAEAQPAISGTGKVALAVDGAAATLPVPSSEPRLFRSFSDMINFNPELKHQTPIASYEMDFLNEKEAHDPSNNMWEAMISKPEFKLYRLKAPDDPVVLVKAYSILKDLPVDVVVHHIRHLPTRAKWDSAFSELQILETDVQNCEIIYCVFKTPWPISSRDFLQWRRWERSPDDANIHRIIMRSASHPKMPLKSGYVRSETLISGYVVRPLPEDPANSSSLFILAQTDIKGLVPKWFVNQAATRSPLQWVENLKKVCNAYIKEHGTTPPVYQANVGLQ